MLHDQEGAFELRPKFSLHSAWLWPRLTERVNSPSREGCSLEGCSMVPPRAIRSSITEQHITQLVKPYNLHTIRGFLGLADHSVPLSKIPQPRQHAWLKVTEKEVLCYCCKEWVKVYRKLMMRILKRLFTIQLADLCTEEAQDSYIRRRCWAQPIRIQFDEETKWASSSSSYTLQYISR